MPTQPEKNHSYGSTVPAPAEELAELADEAREDSDGSYLAEIEDAEGEEGDIVEMEDGSAIVVVKDKEDPEDGEFLTNLASKISATARHRIGSMLAELLEHDVEARKERDKQYAEGIMRMGIQGETKGGAQFEGASRAAHPVLMEGCIDFMSRTMKETFPSKGPVRAHIVGSSDEKKILRARKKQQLLNYQLTQQVSEYPFEQEQLLMQLPLAGSQYKRWRWEPSLNRPCCEFVPQDKVVIPATASNIYTANRFAIVLSVTAEDFEERMDTGFYWRPDGKVPSDVPEPERTATEDASNRVAGLTDTAYNDDGERKMYEVYTWLEIEEDAESGGERAPYIVHLDDANDEVVGVYRNWKESDELRRKLDWVVEYTFIPWRGPLGLGLYHVVGSLSIAATGALRAILDSALLNTMPGGVKVKGGGNAQTIELRPLEFAEVDIGGVDDIRKAIMQLSLPPTSPVLFQVLQWLTDQAKGVVSTAEETIANASNNMPVGTALALIEQGSQVFSALHARIHRSQAKELEILCRLNGQYLTDEMQQDTIGEVLCSREDFETADGVQPVSDPNIFSDSQRYAQLQAVMQLAEQHPELYDIAALHRRALTLLNYQDSEEILKVQPAPFHANAVAENVAVSQGAVLVAAPTDDPLAHLVGHLQYMLDPLLSMTLNPQAYNGLWQHCLQHISFYYATQMQQAANEAVGEDLEEMAGSSEGHALVDSTLAAQVELVQEQIKGALQPLTPLLQAAMQKLQAMQPPQPPVPMDPVIAALQETKRRADKDAVDAQQAMQKLIVEMRMGMEALQRQRDKDAKDFQAALLNVVAKVSPDSAAVGVSAALSTGGAGVQQ
jgi:hypothetical protein